MTADKARCQWDNLSLVPPSGRVNFTMKVTVCFGSVRVVVPCGNGELLVSDLIQKAITRYKKATGKPSDSWVEVHNLKSLNDGGILDQDDKLKDVADDREQLIAVYEEQGSPFLALNNGDGTSASSVGTESPDIFQGSEARPLYQNDVEITCDTVPLGVMSLQVRRGSEPALNRLSPIPSIHSDPSKRWSAAVLGDEERPTVSTPIISVQEDDAKTHGMKDIENVENRPEKSAFLRSSRDTGRLSILGNNAETFRWVEAADRQLFKFQSQEAGLNHLPVQNQQLLEDNIGFSSRNQLPGEFLTGQDLGALVILRNEGGPLGIHVVPDYDESGRDMGLIVQGIEPGGRIDRDGRLHVQDRIVEINNQSLLNINFQKAQEIFKDALQTSEIRLRLMKANDRVVKLPPPVLPKPRTKPVEVVSNGDEEKASDTVPTAPNKTSAAAAAASRNVNTLLVSNTRKIGKKIHIQLKKGSDGLGFSITTRDNPAGGNCPIYIKNILPKGAAVQDGRLKPGDRLLEVNGVEMTGKTQTEAVTVLRNTPLGGAVNLVVSRQEAESPKLPREMPPDKITDDPLIFPWKHRDVMTFDIPLNDTGSAGLGVSVKGKTSTSSNGVVDLGIFVKSVITGGAASKDGRLLENDQLVEVNGASLLGKSNSQAMETLRLAIQQEGPNPGAITLTVARRISSAQRAEAHSAAHADSSGSVSSDNRSTTPDTNSASEHSEGTVIFLPWPPRRDTDDTNLDNHESVRKIEDKDLGLDVPLRNPVVDRIMGQRTAAASLRNESYYRATQDAWSNSPHSPHRPHLMNGSHSKHPNLGNIGPMTSPTVNLTMDDTMIIDDEYTNLPPQNMKLFSVPGPSHNLQINGPLQEKQPEQEAGTRTSTESDFTYISQMSLEEAANAFARDGFGRQSISEKRHAHMDAKNTDTYQRNKKLREEKERQRQQEQRSQRPYDPSNNALLRANSADSLLSLSKSNRSSVDIAAKDVGPVLGMKKSSSLESLQTMVAEVAQEEDGENFARPAVKAVRGRGCNESFRAAVDRSYDVPLDSMGEAMETLDEESESGSSGLGRGNSRQSSLTGEFGPDDIYGRVKKGKKKGLFKGLGQVFKFGKHRKGNTDHLPRLTMQDLERQKLEAEKQRAKKAAEDEQERIQEQYRKLLQRQMEQHHHMGLVNNNNNILVKDKAGEGHSGSQVNRQDRINHLRAQHQRRHQERQGQYPGDDQEEKMEHQLYSHLDRQTHKSRFLRKGPTRYSLQVTSSNSPVHRRAHSQIHPQRYDSEVVHARSRSYDHCKEIERPGSRLGFADSSKYSHYANYEEIQQHLRQQQAYSNYHERPVSNFFEYETIQAGVKKISISDSSTNSLPRRSHHSKASHAHPPPNSALRSDSLYQSYSRKERTKGQSRVAPPPPETFQSSNAGFRPPGQFVSTSRHQMVNRHRDSTNSGSKV